MIDISVIIPHKNDVSDLKRCLDSIPILPNVEVIIVDDNSRKEISDDENFPGLNRENTIVIFDKSDRGAGSARNIGLRNATGKWVMFSDADDFFHEGAFSVFMEITKTNSDLYVFDTDSVMSESMKPVDNRENMVALYKKDKDDNILRYMHHAVWGKMFKKEVFVNRNFKFQEVTASNDAFFAACYGVYAKKIEFVDYIGYCCTVRPMSICTVLSLDNLMARIGVARDINRLYASHGVKMRYWMNRLGPLFNLRLVDKKVFVYQFFVYLKETPFLRVVMDFRTSGLRFVFRCFGKVNDKDIKKLQRVQ